MIQYYNWKYKIIWPLHIYSYQKIDFFGAKMYAVPFFQVRGSHMPWVVWSLLFHVEPLWNIIPKTEMQRSECQGYIMTYLIKSHLYILNRRAVGIFKVLSITNIENFINIFCFIFIIVYVHNLKISSLTFFLLSILFFTFIESI